MKKTENDNENNDLIEAENLAKQIVKMPSKTKDRLKDIMLGISLYDADTNNGKNENEK